jgi:hypothetical protein
MYTLDKKQKEDYADVLSQRFSTSSLMKIGDLDVDFEKLSKILNEKHILKDFILHCKKIFEYNGIACETHDASKFVKFKYLE